MKVAIISFGGISRAPYAAEIMNTVARRKGVGRLIRCKSYGILRTFFNKYVDPSIIHLLSPKQLFRGEKIDLFDPTTINDYDYILNADEKSWVMLKEIAPINTTAKIELLGLYDPYEKRFDMPDIFYEIYRYDHSRKLRWEIRRIYRAANIFIDTHYEEIRGRWRSHTSTPSLYEISFENEKQENISLNQNNIEQFTENSVHA